MRTFLVPTEVLFSEHFKANCVPNLVTKKRRETDPRSSGVLVPFIAGTFSEHPQTANFQEIRIPNLLPKTRFLRVVSIFVGVKIHVFKDRRMRNLFFLG